MARGLVAFLLVATVAYALAADCKYYTAFGGAQSSSEVLSTIKVGESFPVGAVKVQGVVAEHGRVSNVKVSLTHSSGSNPPVTVTLKDVRSGGAAPALNGTGFSDDAPTAFPDATAAPFSAMYQPDQKLSALASSDSAGDYTLRLVDLAMDTEGRKISLSRWTLSLCPGTPPPTPPTPTEAQPVDLSALAASANMTEVEVNTTATPEGSNVTAMSGGADHGSFRSGALGRAQGLLDKLRIKKDDDAPTTLLGLGSSLADTAKGNINNKMDAVKEGHDARVKLATNLVSDIMTNTGDVFKKQHGLVKEGINDVITTTTKAVTGTAQLAKDKMIRGAEVMQRNAQDLRTAHQTVTGFWRNLAAEQQNRMEQKVTSLLSALSGLSNAGIEFGHDVVGVGWNIATALQAQLASSKEVAATAEKLARDKVEAVVQAKVDRATSLLDHLAKFLEGGQDLTGPVLDKKLEMQKRALGHVKSTLASLTDSLDKVPTLTGSADRVMGAAKGVVENSKVAQAVGHVVSGGQSAVDKAFQRLLQRANHTGGLLSKLGL